MQVINVPNVHRALPEGIRLLDTFGIKQDSRNGDVYRAPGPVATVYHKPWQRVIFWEERDANPFLHLMESLWMLAGRNDVGFLAHYAKNMLNFSDDGKTLHGAYGHRWINWFKYDQLQHVINELKVNPNTRRCVLTMWDPSEDPLRAAQGGKDVPCNTQIYFDVLDGELSMTVCCRSNDMIWGAYGANAVHFSVLLEYVAHFSGLDMGRYIQISNNFHVYDNDLLKRVKPLIDMSDDGMGSSTFSDPYCTIVALADHFPLISNTTKDVWDQDVKMFLAEGPTPGLRDPFLRRVAVPMWVAWEIWKKRELDWWDQAQEALSNCKAADWQFAALEWLERRYMKERAKDAGDQE